MICPKCHSDQASIEPVMHGSTHHDGEPLVYWRCGQCRNLFSRLTEPVMDWPLVETDMRAWHNG
jgi:hypothetical protein